MNETWKEYLPYAVVALLLLMLISDLAPMLFFIALGVGGYYLYTTGQWSQILIKLKNWFD